MSEFGLVRSFGVDDGELDEFRRNECFVLGYELGQIDEMLKRHPQPFGSYVHAANQSRVHQACVESGREFKLVWLHGDQSEMWMWLDVGAAAPG